VPVEKVPERRRDFLRRLSYYGEQSGLFKNSTLITTADPCRSCAQGVIDVGVLTVITDADTHRHPMGPKRRTQMEQAEANLHEHGVKHLHVAYRHNL
jgi:deoxycytidylate deaminase